MRHSPGECAWCPSQTPSGSPPSPWQLAPAVMPVNAWRRSRVRFSHRVNCWVFPGVLAPFFAAPGGSGGNSTALVSSRALVVFALQQARSSGSGRVVIGSSGTFWWDVRGRTGIPRRPPESVIPGSAMGNPVSGPRQGGCLPSGRQLPLPTVMTRPDHLSLTRWGILNAPNPAMLPGDYTSWKRKSHIIEFM